jgi:ABC-2 type transport system permease protein
MNNIFLITKREYLTQVKKRSFIILTILAPVLMIAFGAFIAVMLKANETQYTVNVIDKGGLFQGKLKSDEKLKYVYVNPVSETQMVNGLKDMDETAGLLILAPLQGERFDDLEKNSKLLVNDKIGFETKQRIVQDLSAVLREVKIKALNIKEEEIVQLDKNFELKSSNINDKNQVDTDLDFGVKYGLGMVLMYAVFMFIIIYGVRVMRSVLEEKNNRVVEIIISSVKPFELMMGKILGVTLVALTQFIVWITMAVLGALVLNTGFAAMKQNLPAGSEKMVDQLDFAQIAGEVSHILLEMNVPLVIFVFLFFFLFGYIFYSSMYAAIGSAVDNETETQQFTLFAIIPLMIGMYGSITIINNPNGPLGFWLSIIPFTSPVAMVARIPFGVPVWQILLSIVLLILSTFLMVYIAAKVYRVGILMYGNKATMKELWKWIRS